MSLDKTKLDRFVDLARSGKTTEAKNFSEQFSEEEIRFFFSPMCWRLALAERSAETGRKEMASLVKSHFAELQAAAPELQDKVSQLQRKLDGELEKNRVLARELKNAKARADRLSKKLALANGQAGPLYYAVRSKVDSHEKTFDRAEDAKAFAGERLSALSGQQELQVIAVLAEAKIAWR